LIDRARAQIEAIGTISSDQDTMSSAGPGGTSIPSQLSSVAESIPGYEVSREIHRGGQGVVYLATQRSTKKRVAIKIMKEGPFAGSTDRGRFEREVQILGQLQHPNIVNIHASGSVGGCSYFVMDYISGKPLDAHLVPGKHPIRETVALIAKVSDAVNSAHLRGVIHRDLKPSNIRVDSTGEPHILDFGLAKVATEVGGDSDSPAMMTITGQFVGSLPWASPEQAGGEAHKIDIRTDVYSLGVMLYQMLTGRFPYGVTGPMREVLDNIVRSEPARPSTVRVQINDEVETIVLKCLHKDRERRYQTAGELARDIRHFLAGEPIEAKRDSSWYLLKKTLQRYRVPAAVAAGFVTLSAISGISVLYSYFRATREAQRAESALSLAQEAAKNAELQAKRAEQAAETAQLESARAIQEKQKADWLSDFLDRMLASPNPLKEKRGKDATLREALDEWSRIAIAELANDPETQSRVRATLGNTYASLGLFDEAENHLRAALELRRQVFGDEHAEVAASLNDLGVLYRDNKRDQDAEPLLRSAVALRRRLVPDSLPLAISLNDLARALKLRMQQDLFSETESLYTEALEIGRLRAGVDDPRVLMFQNNLAVFMRDKGDYAGAEPIFRECLQRRQAVLGEDDLDVAISRHNLADILERLCQFEEAESLHEKALATRRRLLPSDHPKLLQSLFWMARFRNLTGRYDSAAQFAVDALAIARQKFEKTPKGIAAYLDLLATIRRNQGLYKEAMEVEREALRLYGGESANMETNAAQCVHNLATILFEAGEFDEADRLFRLSLDAFRRKVGEEHHWVGECLTRLGSLNTQQGQYDVAKERFLRAAGILEKKGDVAAASMTELRSNQGRLYLEMSDPLSAERLLREARSSIAAGCSQDWVSLTSVSTDLGAALTRLGSFAEANGLLTDALKTRERLLGHGHPWVAQSLSALGDLRFAEKSLVEAESFYRRAISIRRAAMPDHADTGTTLTSLGEVLLHRGDTAAAETLVIEALQIRRRVFRDNDWRIAETQSVLGACMAAQGDPDGAEALLKQSYQTLLTIRGPNNHETRAALDRLNRFRGLTKAPDSSNP